MQATLTLAVKIMDCLVRLERSWELSIKHRMPHQLLSENLRTRYSIHLSNHSILPAPARQLL